MSYRVVYGETRPAWERVFPTRAEANAYAKEQKKVGDTVFSVKKVVPGEPPQSLMAAIEAARKEDAVERLAHGPRPKPLTAWREDLLRLADGTRTLVEISEQVKGYRYYGGGEYETRPTIDMVSSTLSSLRKKGHDVSWLKNKAGRPFTKMPSKKVLAAMYNELKREKNMRQKYLIERSYAIKYGVAVAVIRQWMNHYYYNLS